MMHIWTHKTWVTPFDGEVLLKKKKKSVSFLCHLSEVHWLKTVGGINIVINISKPHNFPIIHEGLTV